MPNWKKVVVSGSSAALSNLTVDNAITASGLIYPTTDGQDHEVLVTDGSGNLSFDRPNVYATVKNVSGVSLSKGTPVHANGTTGNASNVIAASASVASTMPATYVLNEDLANGAEGVAIVTGFINGVNTSAFSEGDIIYVGENGGYTNVKPTTDSNLIQNLGIVNKVDATNGSGFIYGSGRSNDIPNLPEGKIWVGSSTYSVTSSVVHLDESNERLGIGTTSPASVLHVYGSTSTGNIDNGITIENAGTGDVIMQYLVPGVRRWVTGIDNSDSDSFKIASTADLNTDAALTIKTDGNVGIGTTSPTYKVQIAGAPGAAPLLSLKNTTTATSEDVIMSFNRDNSDTLGVCIGIDSADNSFKIARDGDSINTNPRFTILDGGDIGIGTTSPAYKLDVAGDLRVLSSSISYQENIDVDSAAAETVATVTIADFDAAFFDYVIKNGTNLRAGTVTAVHDGTNVEYNEVSTQDLGSTTAVELSVDISGADMRLRATTTSDNWEIKSLVRTI